MTKVVKTVKPSAVCIMRNSQGRILFLERVFQPLGWCLPGGQIEQHETPLQALRREIMEEVGIITIEHGFRFLRMDVSAHGRDIHVFTYDIPVAKHMVRLSFEHTDFAFFNPDNNKQYLLSGRTASFINAIQKNHAGIHADTH